MKKNRFALRRQQLAARHKCTRCGTCEPKPGCRLCAGCLSVLAAKRELKEDPAAVERRRLRIERRRDVLRDAWQRMQERFERCV